MSWPVGIWSVFRSAVVIWYLLMWDMSVEGLRGSDDSICGMVGCTVGSVMFVGDGWWEL